MLLNNNEEYNDVMSAILDEFKESIGKQLISMRRSLKQDSERTSKAIDMLAGEIKEALEKINDIENYKFDIRDNKRSISKLETKDSDQDKKIYSISTRVNYIGWIIGSWTAGLALLLVTSLPAVIEAVKNLFI